MSEIWKICPSCGGVLGRDCFNTEECAQILKERESEEEDRLNAAQERNDA